MGKKEMAKNLFSRLIVITIFIVLLLGTCQSLSDKRLCADENCKEIISLGKGKINYRAGEEGMVSFRINFPIRIKSKSAGKDPSVWGVEVNGREGYAPKAFIQETKIYISEKDLKFVVDVVKPIAEEPILSTSENFAAKIESVETTTTKPLEFPTTESVVKLPTTANEFKEIDGASATEVTPVLMEIVDGTKVPKIDYDSDGIVESDNDDAVMYTNNKEEFNGSDKYESDDEIGDYDLEDEKEEDDIQANEKLNQSNNKFSEEDFKTQNVQEEGISGENVKDSYASNNSFVHSQESSESFEKSKDKEINEKPPAQVVEVNRNKASEIFILNNSSMIEPETETDNQKHIPENKTDEKLQESKVTDNEQIEANNNNTINIYENEKNTKEVIEDTLGTEVEDLKINNENYNTDGDLTKTNEKNDTNLVANPKPNNYLLDNGANQESIPFLENASDTENNRETDIALKNANESLTEKLDNNPGVNIVPFLENAINSANESELVQTNDVLQENLNNNPKPTNNLNDSNIISKSDYLVEDNSYTPEQEIIYSATDSPQVAETMNGINTLLMEHQMDSFTAEQEVITTTNSPQIAIEESMSEEKPQAYEDSFITTTSNSFSEASTIQQSSEDKANEDLYLSSVTTEVPHNSFHEHYATYDNTASQNSNSHKNPVPNLVEESVTIGYTSSEPLLSDANKNIKEFEEKQKETEASPSTPNEFIDIKENKGLFATIMGTVKSVLSINRIKANGNEDKHELEKMLFTEIGGESKIKTKKEEDLQYCKKIGPNGDCPHQDKQQKLKASAEHCDCSIMEAVFNSNLTFDEFVKALAAKVLEISEVLIFLVIVAATSLLFIFGYYCFCNSSREGALLSKLNQLESSLLASQKENAILKYNLMAVRQKLTSIEDNSFGSNDMVVSLKKDLEEELLEKASLQDQIKALQKELENAADAGIELNKIVSELLSNQTGDESIISSVEELQKQLNEQQNTIMEINASLAEKSRENSELQLLLAEQNARYESELAILQRDNDELEQEKGNLLSQLEELKNDFNRDITTALEGKNIEIKRLQSDILELNNKVETEHTKWQTSLAKVEALEECLKNIRKDPAVNITELIDVANVKAQLIEAQRKYKNIKDRLDSEVDSRKLAENQLQIVSAEVEKLKKDFNQSEKDKLEAQTRLEVLSNYFKEKENQLQRELSLKETMWLKQQGETTTTVDRLTAMQEEIQALKSQNDSLRAEIEAQVAAHKAQTGTLENRAHETWLAARQSDRRYEEARAEATALRRKLTALAGGNINDGNKPSAGPITLSEDLTNVPSPIHMDSPGSPMLGRMPPPPFLPPPFMGPPPPFLGMPPPPPPFVPPGEMRPAPLGRIMSPLPQRSGRFSPQHLDYEDYLDYEGNNTWHRHTYSPPPRTYRSLSPADSRYDYGTERDLMSTYDTETDFSPPPSPRESRRQGGNNSERSDLSKNSTNAKRFNNNKGPLSSGSEKSYKSPSHNDTKTNKSSSGGKSIV